MTEWWNNPDFVKNYSPYHTSQQVWDKRFFTIAREISSWSKCASRNIGAVLVKDSRIIGTGYNGAPEGIDLCQNKNLVCPRKQFGYKSGEGLGLCPAIHAEENAILNAYRMGANPQGGTLYCDCPLPCVRCTGIIISAGIKRVVCLKGIYHKISIKMFMDAGVRVDYYKGDQ